eukprot:scaffold4984_cov63-Phaeocystis_antarctica.AAC.3
MNVPIRLQFSLQPCSPPTWKGLLPYCRPEPPGRLRSRSVWTVQKLSLPEASGANIAASWVRSEASKLSTAASITFQCSAPSALPLAMLASI